MRKALIIFTMLILCTVLASAENTFFLYQEDADEYTGQDTAFKIDGDWTTANKAGNLSINYTKTTLYRPSSIWQVKYGTLPGTTTNFTIPTECWTYSSEKLVFREHNNQSCPTPFWRRFSLECYSSTGWVELYNTSCTGETSVSYQFEEAMYWSMSFEANIYNEENGSAFNIAGHNETKLIAYCENETYETVISQTTQLINYTCLPEFYQLQVQKDTSTYFRTLYFSDNNEINFYMADLNTDSVLEIILNINDLTNEFSEGYVILEKSINDTVVRVAEQQINAENKVTLFLKQNYHYTLKIRNNAGTVRTYGLFYATTAGEKSITLPEISIITSSTLGDNVFYHWERTDAAIKLYYNDTEAATSLLNLSIYNTTDNSLFYSTGDPNVTYATYTVPVSNATTWYACLNATHDTQGDLYNCRYFNAYRSTETNRSTAKLKYWAAVGIVFGICLAATRRFASGILATSTVLFWVFTKLGWVSFGAWGNGIVIAFGSLFAALSMFWEGENT